ncbi:MAG TPA: bifunctional serine/threonine-protein kinase/universal stress protein [Casimicrobiaceae bacterium]|jgi:nucleotide-binding universal stress UspA family protein|nr:bifunctional serine/threonine-protein kinase/universal stress protein [Casimicrobiaceae bacterium]
MMPAPEPGSEIDGFRLGELIHRGSMASIYRLASSDGPLPLIVKIPRLGAGERAVNVIAFEVCRMVLGALAQGRHYPTLVAYGDVETTPYLVMGWIDGVRLDEWIRRAPLQADEIVRLGSALALALHDIHRQDVVHLDIKPTNVLYRPSGEAVLIDFGLAHHAHYPDLLAEELRIPVGNWVYMSPEQILGVRCDPRSDIFALGAILYELTTGRLPFGHPTSVTQLRRRLYRSPVPPRAVAANVPPWLQEVILHCLEIDARDRCDSAAQVAFELGNPGAVALTERATRTAPDGWSAEARRWLAARRYRPAPCPPASTRVGPAPIVLVAIAPTRADEPLLEAMREAARQVIAADERCRIAGVTVVPPAAALSGEGDDQTATGRHIKHLIELKRWAKPLLIPEERVTFHVLESEKPAAALVDYARMNDVEQMLLGAPRSAPARLWRGVCAQVVAEAPCSVTVVRPRA